MKSIVYTKNSTDILNRQQISIESQVIEAKKIFEREGFEIFEIFKEIQSVKES